jgi:hypothetical protein
MKKITDFLNRWGFVIVICLMVLLYAKSCSTGRSADKCNKRIDALEKQIAADDSVFSAALNEINGKCIERNDMIYLLRTTENTKTLIIEELVDKKQLSMQDLYNNLNDAEGKK